MDTVKNIIQRLRNSGSRITKTRVALLDIFSVSSAPLSVGQLLSTLAKQGSKVNKTTVYRELDFFLAQGLVRELSLGERKKRYELTSLGHHHHLICKRCERIEDIPFDEELSQVESLVSERTTFRIESHSLEFFGLCATCQS